MDRDLDRMLSRLVEEIERVEITRNQFGSVMKQIKNSINLGRFPAIAANTLDTQFVTHINQTNLAGLTIAGVDGGLVKKNFRSMDLILTRAIGVIFQFGLESSPNVEFYPDPFPEPIIKPVMISLSSSELDQYASLERITAELRVTLSIMDEFHTDIILVDGSLLYHPRDRPPSGSLAYEKFQETIALYRQIYHKARKKRTTLVGIVKDTRSTRVVGIIGEILPHIIRDPAIFELMQGIDYRWLLKISRDSDILDTFLEEGERTFSFRYSVEFPENTGFLSEDIKEWASSIWVTYLKTARDDSPLRLEIFGSDNDQPSEMINKALSAILPVSCHHPEYGLPSPIVEADTRARIGNNETRFILDRILALSGLTYSSLEKRRSRNPFGGY